MAVTAPSTVQAGLVGDSSGMAGAGTMSTVMGDGDQQEGDRQIQQQVASEPGSPSAVAGQAEDTPALPAPDTESRDGYVDPDAGGVGQPDTTAAAGQDTTAAATADRSADGDQSADSSAVGTAATDSDDTTTDTGSAGQPDTAGADSQSDVTLDPSTQSPEEFRDAWAQSSNTRQADFLYSDAQSDHPARRLVKEMAGPAAGIAVGTAISMTGVGALGLGGAALAGAASAAGSGTVAFALKEATDKGVRGSWQSVTTAGKDAFSTVGTRVSNGFNEYVNLGTSGGSGDGSSVGSTDGKEDIRGKS